MTIGSLDGAFWRAAAVSLLVTLMLLGGIGWLAAKLLAGPKPIRFANNFFEFRLPHDWHCRQERTEQVCRYAKDAETAKRSAIILTMKFRGPQDTYDAYLEHLQTPRLLRTGADGRMVRDDEPSVHETPSKVHYARRRRIGEHEWVEGLHFASEIPYYFTQYHATVIAQIAVLITYSAHQGVYENHRADIETMVRSLVLFQAAANAALAR